MSQRNAEQVSEAILKAVLRKNIDEQVIGDVSAQELVGLVANNFSSCPACGAEPWTNIDCHVCGIMGIFESKPRADRTASERCETIVEGFVNKYRALYDDDCRGGNELHSSYGGPLSVAEQILAKIRGER